MELHELSFAKIIILRDDIAEVIVNDGVEMDVKMVEEYHEFLLSHMRSPFAILINKVNSYTYTFEAQMRLATLKEINVMAAVVYKRAAEISTEALVTTIPREVKWNLKVFSSREEALSWLIEEHDKLVKPES